MYFHDVNTILQILSKDFSSLNSDLWLTDTIIEAYLSSFVEKEKLYVLSSIQAFKIAETGSTKTVIRKPLAELRYILGPVHINKNHWALLFVNMKAKAVMYIDWREYNYIRKSFE